MAEHRAETTTFKYRLALGLIFLLALVLRMWGIRYGLIEGLSFHPDEPTYVLRASRMTWHDLNPRYFINPSLYIYFLFFQIQVVKLLGVFKSSQVAGSNVPFLIGRMTSALLGSSTVLVLYFVGKHLFSRKVGLLAALLLSVAFMHCRDSHFAVSDITMTFFLTLAFYFCIRYVNTGQRVHSLCAGLLAGIAVSAKYSAGLIITTIVVAHILVALSRKASVRRAAADLQMSFLCMIAGFLIATPYSLLDLDSFVRDFSLQHGLRLTPWFSQPRDQVWLLYWEALGLGMGWVLLALSSLGLVLVALANRKRVFLIAAFPLCYYAYMGSLKLFAYRFALPLLPFMVLFAAFSIGYLMDKTWPGLSGRVATAALLLAAVGQPTYKSVMHDHLLTRKDTRELASEWLRENLPAGSVIAMDRRVPVDASTYTVLRFEDDLARHELEYYRNRGVEFVIVSQYLYARYRQDPERYRKEVSFYDRLAVEAALVKTFHPSKDGTEIPFSGPQTFSPVTHLSSLERPGPTLKIYQL